MPTRRVATRTAMRECKLLLIDPQGFGLGTIWCLCLGIWWFILDIWHLNLAPRRFFTCLCFMFQFFSLPFNWCSEVWRGGWETFFMMCVPELGILGLQFVVVCWKQYMAMVVWNPLPSLNCICSKVSRLSKDIYFYKSVGVTVN